MGKRKALKEPLRVGGVKTIAFDLYYEGGDNHGSARAATSCLVHAVDPNRQIEGVCDAGSGAGVIIDADVLDDYAANELKGLSIILIDADDRQYRSEITANSPTGKSVSLTTFEISPSTGDVFLIEGTPTLASTAATVSTARVSYQVSKADLTAYPHRGYMVLTPTYTSGDTDELILDYEVLPSVAEP